MLKIIIVGGAGFIGSNLTKHLLEMGHKVTCLDNFSTSTVTNVLDVMNHPNFELVTWDLVSYDNRDAEIFETADVVYNLASIPSPKDYINRCDETIEVNITGVMNLLKLIPDTVRLIHISSSEIYGDTGKPEQVEDDIDCIIDTNSVRSCYSESKRVGETLVFNSIRSGLNGTVVRVFNTYGPGMLPEDGRVVTEFLTADIESKSMVIVGNGRQTRSFCYIDDMCTALIRLIDVPVRVINLGNPEEITITSLAHLCNTKGIVPTFTELRAIGDVTSRKPNIDIATEVLEWIPSTPLHEGLELTREYLIKTLKRNCNQAGV